jgi:hypothetical protein
MMGCIFIYGRAFGCGREGEILDLCHKHGRSLGWNFTEAGCLRAFDFFCCFFFLLTLWRNVITMINIYKQLSICLNKSYVWALYLINIIEDSLVCQSTLKSCAEAIASVASVDVQICQKIYIRWHPNTGYLEFSLAVLVNKVPLFE